MSRQSSLLKFWSTKSSNEASDPSIENRNDPESDGEGDVVDPGQTSDEGVAVTHGHSSSDTVRNVLSESEFYLKHLFHDF